MIKVRVLFFATYRSRAGTNETELEIQEGATVSDLKQLLANKSPAVAEAFDAGLVAINKEYAFDDEVIPVGAEIALFPPVSGGSDLPTKCVITNHPFDYDGILSELTLPTTGASCVFTGMVRAETERGKGHTTDYLEYESYEPMAEEKMYKIAVEIRKKWTAIEGVAIVQRVGRLYPGEPTVMVACTAAHRDTGVFEAARYGIDRLKEIVPVWKKEVGPNGEMWVEGEYIPKRDD